jgi:hypothetical protein
MKLGCFIINRSIKLGVWLPVAKKFKSQPSVGKISFRSFLEDMEGEILVHFTPKGETANSQISICSTQWKKL